MKKTTLLLRKNEMFLNIGIKTSLGTRKRWAIVLLLSVVLLFSGLYETKAQQFYENNEIVVMEAEDYITSAAGTDSREWIIVNDDASGGQAVFTEDWGDN
ncbi:MAG: hypothetical protein ACOCXD_02210 [Bacteroidota bacterium]